MSEHLLIGIAISSAASILAGGCAGVMKGLYTSHSGPTLRALIVCENVWVIVVLGTEARQLFLALGNVSTKDWVLIGLIFVLTIPSLIWIYSRSDAVAEAITLRLWANSE